MRRILLVLALLAVFAPAPGLAGPAGGPAARPRPSVSELLQRGAAVRVQMDAMTRRIGRLEAKAAKARNEHELRVLKRRAEELRRELSELRRYEIMLRLAVMRGRR